MSKREKEACVSLHTGSCIGCNYYDWRQHKKDYDAEPLGEEPLSCPDEVSMLPLQNRHLPII